MATDSDIAPRPEPSLPRARSGREHREGSGTCPSDPVQLARPRNAGLNSDLHLLAVLEEAEAGPARPA